MENMVKKNDIWRLPKELNIKGLKTNLQISITKNGEYLIEYINELGITMLSSKNILFDQAFWRMKKHVDKCILD